MIRYLSFLTLATLLTVTALSSSCKKPPLRVESSYGKGTRGEGKVKGETGTGEPETLIEQGDPSPIDPEITDDGIIKTPPVTPGNPQARRSTIQTIMLAAGDKADQSCETGDRKGRASLRLLTKDEYQNSIKAILKVAVDYRPTLPRETVIEGFRNNLDYGRISDQHAAAYLEAAINIADEIHPNLKTLAACTTIDEACATRFIDTLGPRLWRRPLETAEKEALKASFKKGAVSSARHGMTMMISRMLMSPHFLYRSELGTSSKGQLTPYELASALSYFFWGTPPDDTLLSAASSGKLSDEKSLIAEAERLLLDPRSRFVSSEFARAWLDTQAVKGAIKDDSIFPAFTQNVKNAMAAEAEDTFDHFMRSKTSRFEDLFQSDYSIGDAALAKYYGASSSMGRINFQSSGRKGVLGYGALLSLLSSPKETHPIRRGNFVLGKIFCQYPEPTPPGLNVEFPPFDPALSTRERFAKHTEDVACASCHKSIDGIGLGMEDFDGAGQFREMQAGKKIDASGAILSIDGKNTNFSGTAALSDYIAKSRQAKRCFAVEWYRLAHGHLERPEDVCAIRDIANAFEKENMSLGQLLIEIVTHPSYRNKGE